MRILVLEYVSSPISNVDTFLFPEGFAILRTMVDEFDKADFDVITMLHEDLVDYKDWLSAGRILIQKKLDSAIEMNPDAALVVAPNSNGELERLSNKLRANDISVMGSSKYSFRKTRDKWKTYQVLKGVVPQPKSWEKSPKRNDPVLVKPKKGTGCEDIFVSSPSEVDEQEETMFQEYKKGIHASCCLLGKEGKATVLSVNGQLVKRYGNCFRYEGGYVPLESQREEECVEISKKVSEVFNMSGYYGVDLVLGDEIWFIELNPRVTTSFVGLAQNTKANLGRMLVDTMVNDNLSSKPELTEHSTIKMPRLKKEIKASPNSIKGLKKIPEIMSPPLPMSGRLQKDSPIFLAASQGTGLEENRKNLRESMEEAINYMGVDKNAVAWP